MFHCIIIVANYYCYFVVVIVVFIIVITMAVLFVVTKSTFCMCWQRTELYEYSRVLGNSQFLLLPFQPYKLIYAHMLAEVGKVGDALK